MKKHCWGYIFMSSAGIQTAYADGLSSLQSEALSSLDAGRVDAIFSTNTQLDLSTLPPILYPQSDIKRQLINVISPNTFSCNVFGRGIRPIKIAYTMTFQHAQQTWIPLTGKVHYQSFWQVKGSDVEYIWVSETINKTDK
ncbi:hypothetical protein K8B83_20770 [Shewanella inventionis]|nr:hypothetical protein [Shewanella inventionis]MCL1159950.1 hypothetical protein [Shewanella inventionis]UAL43193.1 hypothetical protein K8B83_20770 [Shewanella inventionis]